MPNPDIFALYFLAGMCIFGGVILIVVSIYIILKGEPDEPND